MERPAVSANQIHSAGVFARRKSKELVFWRGMNSVIPSLICTIAFLMACPMYKLCVNIAIKNYRYNKSTPPPPHFAI